MRATNLTLNLGGGCVGVVVVHRGVKSLLMLSAAVDDHDDDG